MSQERDLIKQFLSRRNQWRRLYGAEYTNKFFTLYDGELETIETALRTEACDGRQAAFEEVRVMLEEQRNECLQTDNIRNTGYNRLRADELDNALINLRALRAEAALRAETPTAAPLYRRVDQSIVPANGKDWPPILRDGRCDVAFLDKIVAALNGQARAETPAPRERALKQFIEWFVANYPGPDTVIFDPAWHAPKIFRAVEAALIRAAGEPEQEK